MDTVIYSGKKEKKQNNFWIVFTRTVRFACSTITLFGLIAILAPIAYFTWRAGQLMEIREFNDLSFDQFMVWKKNYLCPGRATL